MPKCGIKGCKNAGKYTVKPPGYQGHADLTVCLDHYLEIQQGAELEVEDDARDAEQPNGADADDAAEAARPSSKSKAGDS